MVLSLITGLVLANALVALSHVEERSLKTTERRAIAQAARFLESYVDSDGRVVRHDHGGDTVAEGQAYAMLLAIATGDAATFARIWTWTVANLQRDDGLLSTHWADGEIIDANPAADADVDAARALLAASELFDEPRYRQEALRIADAILEAQTVDTPLGLVLVAGPWGRDSPAVVNPSYFDPVSFAQFAEATGDDRWHDLRESSYEIVRLLTEDPPRLPADWIWIHVNGEVEAVGGPDDDRGAPVYGFEAGRVPVRFAVDCDRRGQSLAVRLWGQHLADLTRPSLMIRDIAGDAVSDLESPLALVAAAGAAAGESEEHMLRLLDEAERLSEDVRTYYGDAWVALGRVLLTTPILGGCR